MIIRGKKVEIKIIIVALYLCIIAATAGCTESKDTNRAYGNIEADEITISAQANGVLNRFDITEGVTVNRGDDIGCIDTTQLNIQRVELASEVAVLESQVRQLSAQTNVFKNSKKNLEREMRRVVKLLESDAATTKQRDDIEGEIVVIESQIEQIASQRPVLKAQIERLKSKRLLINDMVKKSRIISPLSGTVITKFAEQHEMVVVGKPLYRVTNLKKLYAKVYITESQLSDIRLGAVVPILYDGKGTKSYNGVISFISSEAEFTPKTIQTEEERVDLVYGVKVQIDNDGTFKIGMPVAVELRR